LRQFPSSGETVQPGWYPAQLQLIADAELAFVVDPIDGTKNFTANLPLFGVMAAVRSAPRSISWLSTKND
jgi:3'-phosphoadenosine 5'-phosphosulfate (PAPS) 3'-phosphatase